ncbi:MAG: PilZ domain-containing protein [Alphaproteobacteria bacterium]|nr:PilZ domain-containing protein [Alphaproteobacteria bacterium]
MSEDRRRFERRATQTNVRIESLKGDVLDESADAENISVGGIRLKTGANLVKGAHYLVKLKLAGTDSFFDVEVLAQNGDSYRCRVETEDERFDDIIRQHDDLALLALGSTK